MKLLILGFVLILAAIWGEAYIGENLAKTWMNFPSVCTVSVIGFAGLLCVFIGLDFKYVKADNDSKNKVKINEEN